MKVYPIYDSKPLPKDTKLKNILGLRALEKKSLGMFMEENDVYPKSWLLDGWLSTRVKRVATLRAALFIAEWSQQRKGFHPLAVLTALAKYPEGAPEPHFSQAPPSREALKDILKEARGLSLDDNDDFERLLDILIDGIVEAELFWKTQ